MTSSTSAQPLSAAQKQSKLFERGNINPGDLTTPELVLGLCGPIGSPIHEVSHRLKEALEDKYNYHVEVIRLSQFIREKVPETQRQSLITIPANSSAGFTEKRQLIAAGNHLREQYEPSILADLAIHRIATSRDHGRETSSRRHCFIIDSIKNSQELHQLRNTYGEIFYFIGCFSSLDKRREELSKQMTQSELHQIVDQDSGEELDHGQTVRNVFPECDYFIRIDSKTDTVIEKKVERLLDVLFHTRIVTPTIHETAMYHAASAAGNSACLSRQVGAAVTDKNGEIISIGWNDVPKFGGGVYRSSIDVSSTESDHRCWNLDGGQCFNDQEKDVLTSFIVEKLVADGIIMASKKQDAITSVRSSGKLGQLLEFSRSIHAEMNAIISAGHTNGEKLKEAMLFATTYPCHSCARHIVASGIKDVYFIEPYRKSLAVKLHGDAISESEMDTNKVRVLMYEGVAPRRYYSLFRIPEGVDRKLGGKMKRIHPKEALPVISTSLESIPVLESITVKKLQDLQLID